MPWYHPPGKDCEHTGKGVKGARLPIFNLQFHPPASLLAHSLYVAVCIHGQGPLVAGNKLALTNQSRNQWKDVV